MRELTMTLDAASKAPLYQQIYLYLKKEIKERQILPGERLPSSRALAKQLQVSRTTVDMAYGQLIDEGYLEARPWSGYYVADFVDLYQVPPKGEENFPALQAEAVKTENSEEILIHFDPNGFSQEAFPEKEWKRLYKEAVQGPEDLTALGDSRGEESLREVLSRYLRHSRGIRCDKSQIILGAGNDYLLMLLSLLLGKDRTIAMESPTYKGAWEDFTALGYQIIALGSDEEGIRVDELEACGADMVYVMPAHQFPLGRVMPFGRRNRLLAWAYGKDGRYIIEDDYDSEFRYKGKPIPALQGGDQQGQVIYIGTLSRMIAPSLRISYMVLPEGLVEVYETRGRCFSATVSRFDQKVLELFLESGAFERHMNRLRSRYKGIRKLLLHKLKSMMELLEVEGDQAGVHIVLRLKNGMTEDEALASARKAGVLVHGISEYKILSSDGERSQTRIVLGYGGLDAENVTEGIERLAKAWASKEEKG